MARTVKIELKDGNPVAAVQGFLKTLLRAGCVDAVFTPLHLPGKNAVMPTLVADPERLDTADPFAPAFPLNAARMLSRLTRKPVGGKVAAVMRPCEIRAFIELVKLRQGGLDDVVLVGVDCFGAYGNLDYERFAAGEGPASTLRFHQSIREGKGTVFGDVDLSPACKACEHPIPGNADLIIQLIGADWRDSLTIEAVTPKGEASIEKQGLPETGEPPGRKAAAADLISLRTAYRDRMFKETSEATSDLEKLMNTLGNCVNCYNCRAACPVCYCRECVFTTDVFDHEPSQYLRWARRKGILKMPTDTVFYHLTRLAHMSTACIGCGQCSNACPNNVPVMEIFRTIANCTQKAFGYEAGKSIEDEPPLSTFREREFPEVTGGKN